MKFFATRQQILMNQLLISLSRESDTEDGSEVDSGNASASGNVSPRALRLVASKETLEELLEKLLRNIDKSSGIAQQNYFQQLLIILIKHPDLINRVPKNFHSNPLELAIKVGDFRMVKELLILRAQVRPENSFLLKRIKHLIELDDVPISNLNTKPRKK